MNWGKEGRRSRRGQGPSFLVLAASHSSLEWFSGTAGDGGSGFSAFLPLWSFGRIRSSIWPCARPLPALFFFFFHTHPARWDNATPHGAALTPSLSSFTSSCSKPATLVYTRFLPASHPCFPPLSPLHQRRLGCHCAALTASDQKNCPKAAHCVGKLHDSLQVPGSVPEVVDVRYSVPPRSSREERAVFPLSGV